ncbi:uncharacterized protein LOC118368788 [Oncorhynchus keta]|uniref:uncharacterized protein LOC118368788 n=1 Tax=Oncorhynchus keta TaxID=8018 RepID=UPI0015FABE11|nr:uncharacterized protein LOC118368788 [Oncorhynchus keta]
MSDQSKCTTIYMSRELRQASDKALSTGAQEIRFPDHKSPPSLRIGQIQSHHLSLGIRRSFASTDLLTNAHPHSAHSALSLDSLEGVLSLHSDSRVELQPTSDTTLNPRSSHSSRLSLEAIALPAGGEGKCSDGKKSLGTEHEENWQDARDGTNELHPEDDEDSGSLESIDEEEEEEGLMVVNLKASKEKRKKRHDVEGTSTESPSKYLQEFHSLPKRLVPSEITHCLYELEEECRGVERESDSVKWKMELIHRSVVTVQETLRTLLKRLVEAQSNEALDPTPIPTTHHLLSTTHHRPPHSPSHSLFHSANPLLLADAPTKILSASQVNQVPSNLSQCTHHHCLAHRSVARRPSETCLTEANATLTQGHCCPRTTSPGTATLTSCAQRGKERAAALHAITDLRMDVEHLRAAYEEGRQEHRETLEVLRTFQKDMGTLVSHWQRDRQDRQKQSDVGTQLEAIRQQSNNVTEMTRQAVAVFGKVGLQLEGLGAVGTLVRSASTKLTPNSSLLCQCCTSKTMDGESKED